MPDKTHNNLTATSLGNLSELSQLQILQSVIEKNASLRMKAYGCSMRPFIKDGDVLIVAPLDDNPLKVGDVIAFSTPTINRLIIHRIIKKYDYYLIKGDHACEPDGWIREVDIIGKVIQVERKGRIIRFGITCCAAGVARLSRHKIIQLINNITEKIASICNR